MSDKANMPAVDLDRMSVQQLTALIAAAEAKRRDKLEDAKVALPWGHHSCPSVSPGAASSGAAKGYQDYMGRKKTTDFNSTPPAVTVSRAHTNITRRSNSISAPPAPTVSTALSNNTKDKMFSIAIIIVFVVIFPVLIVFSVFSGGR